MAIATPKLYSLYDEDVRGLLNTHVGTANYLLPPLQQTQALPDVAFTSNESIWQAILPPQERLHANVTVRLDSFFLFEWFPRKEKEIGRAHV